MYVYNIYIYNDLVLERDWLIIFIDKSMNSQPHFEKFMHIFSYTLNNLYVVDDPY